MKYYEIPVTLDSLIAAGAQVERVARPWGWHAGDGTPAHPADRVAQWPAHNRERMTQPVYDQAALDAEVASERERLCAAIKAADDKASEGDYMLDSDDCISVIRGTWNPGA